MAGIDRSEQLNQNNLQTAEAVLGLGMVVVKALSQHGVATVFINADGQVELCPFGEIELDGVDQEDALSVLLERGYQDEQLFAYLRGRKAREARHG